MRIAINATILDDKPTGLGIYTTNVVQEISKHIGCKDKLIVFTSYPEAFGEYNLEIRRVSKWVQPKYGEKAGVFRFLWSQTIFPLRLMKDNVDLVYSSTHHGTLFPGASQVITIHDTASGRAYMQHTLVHYYFKFILPILLKKCSAIIAVSKEVKKDIIGHVNFPLHRIHVVYNSYNKKYFKPMDSEDFKFRYKLDKYLLTVNASYPHKNIGRILEAYLKIRGKIAHKLVIVGKEGRYMDSLRTKTKILGLQKDIRFLGYVPQNILPPIYSGASALIYPSLYEGFGFPPIEAMACGCPVIVSNTSSLPEVCGNAAYYVDPCSVASIAEGIYRVSTGENLKQDLVQKGFKRVKLFGWQRAARQIIKIFKQILQK